MCVKCLGSFKKDLTSILIPWLLMGWYGGWGRCKFGKVESKKEIG